MMRTFFDTPGIARRRILIAVLLALFVGVGCSSVKPSPDPLPGDGKAAQVVDEMGPELAGLIFDAHTPLVVKFRPNALAELGRRYEKRIARTESEALKVIMPVVSGGLYKVFSNRFGSPDTNQYIDPERPSYFTLGVSAPEDFYRLSRYGALWLARDEYPRTLFGRLIIPTQEPVKLAQALESHRAKMERPEVGLVISPATQHVVMEFLKSNQVFPEKAQTPSSLLIPHEGAEITLPETPAFREFDTSISALAIYLDMERMREFGAAMEQFNAGRLIAQASHPERGISSLLERDLLVPQYRADGVSKVLALLAVLPKPPREYVDYLMTLDADGEEGATLELLGTRSALGVRIAQTAPHELPAFSEVSLPAEDALIEAHLGHNQGSAVSNSEMDYWDGPESARQATTSESGTSTRDMLRYLKRVRTEFAYMLSGLDSPYMFVRFVGGPSVGGREFIPLAGAFRAVPANTSATSSKIQMQAAGVFLFGGIDEAVQKTIMAEFREIIQSQNLPITLRFLSREEGKVEVRYAINMSLEQAFVADGETVPVEGIYARVSPKLFEILNPRPQTFAWGLKSIGPLLLSDAHESAVQLTRLHLGAGDLRAASAPLTDYIAPPRRPGCIDRLNLESLELFRLWVSSNFSKQSPESVDPNVFFDALARTCIEDAPEHKAEIELAMARKRTGFGAYYFDLLHWHASNQGYCEQGEERACEAVARVQDAELAHNRSNAEAWLKIGCEMGDTKGCQILDALDALDFGNSK